jgi:uncharacterized membrane protein
VWVYSEFLNRFTKLLKDDHIKSSYFYFVVDIAELQDFGIGSCISSQMRSQKVVGAAGLQLFPPPAIRGGGGGHRFCSQFDIKRLYMIYASDEISR